MSNDIHSEHYTALLNFLQLHGLEALDGVTERGMPIDRALEFIAMLETHRIAIFGLEVWRNTPKGYSLDFTSIWYCTTGKHHEYDQARIGLRLAAPKSKDLVAVQFAEIDA